MAAPEWVMPAAIALGAATLMLRLVRRSRQARDRAIAAAMPAERGERATVTTHRGERGIDDGLVRAEELIREAEARLNTKLLTLSRLTHDLDRRLDPGAPEPSGGRSPLPSERLATGAGGWMEGAGDRALNADPAAARRRRSGEFEPVIATRAEVRTDAESASSDPRLTSATIDAAGPAPAHWWSESHSLLTALDLLDRGESVEHVARLTRRPRDQIDVLKSLLGESSGRR